MRMSSRKLDEAADDGVLPGSVRPPEEIADIVHLRIAWVHGLSSSLCTASLGRRFFPTEF